MTGEKPIELGNSENPVPVFPLQECGKILSGTPPPIIRYSRILASGCTAPTPPDVDVTANSPLRLPSVYRLYFACFYPVNTPFSLKITLDNRFTPA